MEEGYNLSIAEMVDRLRDDVQRYYAADDDHMAARTRMLIRMIEGLKDRHGSYEDIPLRAIQEAIEVIDTPIHTIQGATIRNGTDFVMLDSNGRVIPQTTPGFTTPEGSGFRPGSNLPAETFPEPAGTSGRGLGHGTVQDAIRTDIDVIRGQPSVPTSTVVPHSSTAPVSRPSILSSVGSMVDSVMSHPATRVVAAGAGTGLGALGAIDYLSGTPLNEGEDEALQMEIARIEQLRSILTPEEFNEYEQARIDHAAAVAAAPRTPDGTPILPAGSSSEIMAWNRLIDDRLRAAGQTRVTTPVSTSTPVHMTVTPGPDGTMTTSTVPLTSTSSVPPAQATPGDTASTSAVPLTPTSSVPPVAAQQTTPSGLPVTYGAGNTEATVDIRPLMAETARATEGNPMARIPYQERLRAATAELISRAEAQRGTPSTTASGGATGQSQATPSAPSRASPQGASYAETKDSSNMTQDEWASFLRMMRERNIQGFNFGGYAFAMDDTMPSGYRVVLDTGRARNPPVGVGLGAPQ